MSVWTQPSPSDWDRWEQRLLDGEEPSQAARAEGQTCSAFKRTDPGRHAEALAASREIRAGEDREYVRDKLRENVEQAMRAVPVFDKDGEPTGEYTYRGDYANKALELLGKGAGMFGDRVEVTGDGGGPVEVSVDHDSESARRILDKLVAVGLVRPGPVAAVDAEGQRVLPAPAD